MIEWFLLAAGALGIASYTAAIQHRRSRDETTRRNFRARPRQLIAAVRDGEIVKLVGTAAVQEPVNATLSGRMAAYVERVDEVLYDSVWRERGRQIFGRDFILTDSSGEALIVVDGAEVLLMKDKEAYSIDARIREGTVCDRDRVAVIGRGNWELDPRPAQAVAGYRERRTVLVIRGDARQRLLLTDSPALTGRS